MVVDGDDGGAGRFCGGSEEDGRLAAIGSDLDPDAHRVGSRQVLLRNPIQRDGLVDRHEAGSLGRGVQVPFARLVVSGFGYRCHTGDPIGASA